MLQTTFKSYQISNFRIRIENESSTTSRVNVKLMTDIKLDKQRDDFSSFDWLPVSSVDCRLGSDRYLASLLNLDHS